MWRGAAPESHVIAQRGHNLAVVCLPLHGLRSSSRTRPATTASLEEKKSANPSVRPHSVFHAVTSSTRHVRLPLTSATTLANADNTTWSQTHPAWIPFRHLVHENLTETCSHTCDLRWHMLSQPMSFVHCFWTTSCAHCKKMHVGSGGRRIPSHTHCNNVRSTTSHKLQQWRQQSCMC